MAVNTITYANKVNLNENSGIAETNKITDANMNEIKSVVNNNATELSNLQPVLLWTNPNPTSPFASQTISVDFSNCDMYELVYYQSITRTNRELSSGKIRVGKGSIASYGGGQVRAWDGSNTSLTFENANDNQYLIPAYVIGYKTGLF